MASRLKLADAETVNQEIGFSFRTAG